MMDFQKTNTSRKQTANLQLVKETNLALVFNLIYRHGPVSRAELAQKTRMSPTTVSSLIEELLKNDIAVETGAGKTSTSGRKPIMVEINPCGGYVIAYEIVENGILGSLYDLLCRQVDEFHYEVTDFESLGTRMIEAAEKLIARHGIPEKKLLGFSIGFPGLINHMEQRVISSTVVTVGTGNDFCGRMRERFSGVPVFFENQSYFCAYAEKQFGIGENIQNLIFIDINIGIGAGIIVEGGMFRGTSGMAGEIGHISIDMNGPRCKCGNRGCLEIMASIPAMVQKIVFAVMSGRDTVIKEITQNDLNKINVDVISRAIKRNDGLATEIADEIALKLAFGINNVVNLFNPQVVVIGGEITKIGDAFLDRVREHLRSIELMPGMNRPELKYSYLKGNTASLGGARYALDNIFKIPGLFKE